MTTHAICDACECVSHCSKNGCIPLTPIFRAPSVGGSGRGEWPTKEMVDAGLRRMLGDKQYSAPWEDVIYNMFRDMLAAAPHQSQEAQGDRHGE